MIVLDLPKPLSTNRTRKIDWAAKKRINAWVDSADRLVMSQGKLASPIMGRYEATVILPEGSKIDADNTTKGVLDYARRIGLVTDDSPKYLRKLTVEFGEAPEGCKLVLRGLE